MTSAQRVARNEALFREVNDRIFEVSEGFGGGEGTLLDFICECATPGCKETASTSRETYLEIRADSTRFLVLRGHEDLEHERIVRELGDVLVVEKLGVAADTAADLDGDA